MQKIIDGLGAYCEETGVESLRELTGQVRLDRQLSDRWLRFAQQSG
jgi:dihydroorotate dehydrogenase (NAD+) catalytic subunit